MNRIRKWIAQVHERYGYVEVPIVILSSLVLIMIGLVLLEHILSATI